MDSQRIRQRRRRVALEQTQTATPGTRAKTGTGDGACEETAESSKATPRPYTQAASRSRQFRTTDLIPKRIGSVAAVVALLFAAIAGLNLLHLNSPGWIGAIGNEGVQALSLDSPRGIGVWYANFLLLLTSCVSLQLYLLRQHRCDDYRGSYRIWLWLAGIFLIASATSVTGIPDLCRNLLGSVAGSTSPGHGLSLMLILKLAGLVLLFVRGLIEVRFSRLAIFGLVLVSLAYGTAALINEIPEVQARASGVIHSALGNCLLVGCTTLFITVLGYARYVYLDANGLIQSRSAAASESAVKKEIKKKNKKDAKNAKDAAASATSQKSTGSATGTAKAPRTKKPRRQATVDSSAKRPDKQDDKPTEKQTKKTSRRKTVTKNSQPVEPQPPQPAKLKSESGEPPAGKTPGSKQRKKKKPAASDAGSGDSPLSGDDYLLSIDDDATESLSKAERRRLRKLKRRAA